MANPSTVQIKAFVPAIDYTRCRALCCEPGYTVASEGGRLACFHCDGSTFLLHDNTGVRNIDACYRVD